MPDSTVSITFTVSDTGKTVSTPPDGDDPETRQRYD